MSEFEPSILCFACNWCSYAAADIAGTSRIHYPPNVRLLRVMCSGMVDAEYVMKALEAGRIGIAAQAVGIASGAMERSIQYSKERKTFGTEIANHQAIAFKIADMAVKVENARNLCLKAAWLEDNGKSFALAGSMAKQYCADIAMEVTTEAVQIHGGYGYVKEYHVERLMREAKLTQIYEGTSEIQKIVISRALLRD